MSVEGDGTTEDTIKVVIRLRPPIQKEIGLSTVWYVPSERTIQRRDGKEEYTFDRVYDGMSRTEDVYNESVIEVVKSAMAGYNGTVFAYGQTASGKTYTIFGDKHSDGVVQMAVDTIFSTIESGGSRRYLLRMSCVEIYNERVRDLLSDHNDLPILEMKGNVVISGIIEEVITDRTGVDTLIQAAFERRAVGETSLNERSSRSHAILRFVIESHDDDPQVGTASYIAYLNVVDLAGSENAEQTGTEELRLREGSNVNRSLFTLSRVISQLTTKNSYVSFRDSKLTRLLKTSLGGNSKTLIICTASPVALTETSQALKFASRAKFVKNKPVKNKVTEDALLSKYLRTIEELRRQLEENQKTDDYERDLEAQNEQLSAEVRRLRGCILSGQQQQQLPLIADERKRRKARRQTWGGARAFRMSMSPTFGGFGSSMGLFHGKYMLGSPIEEETTSCASGRSSMESGENQCVVIPEASEEIPAKSSCRLKTLEEEGEGLSDAANSSSNGTPQAISASNVLIQDSQHQSGAMPSSDHIVDECGRSFRSDPVNTTAVPSRRVGFGTATYIPHSKEDAELMHNGVNASVLSDDAAMLQNAVNASSHASLLLGATALDSSNKLMTTSGPVDTNNGSRSLANVTYVTIGQNSQVSRTSLTEIGNEFMQLDNGVDDRLSDDIMKHTGTENSAVEYDKTPAKVNMLHGSIGESPSEEENAPAKNSLVDDVTKYAGDVEMKTDTARAMSRDGRYDDGHILETSVIAFSTCRLSIDELREELEEERMAREKERLELVETIAQLKKRLLIHEDRAHDLSKTSGRSMDPQLEEERETNNRLRNILFEGKKKYEEIKAINKQLEERLKLVESENELWGRRCDEADETERQLREEIVLFDCQKKKFCAEMESLKQQLEDMKKQLQLQQSNSIAEGLELQRLRDEKKELEKLVKKLQKEVLLRDKKVSALQCELRRVSSVRNPGDVELSPAHEEAASTISHDSHTPTATHSGRNPGIMPPLAPSKQKFGMSPGIRADQHDFENSPNSSEAPGECIQQ
uniref:Centromere-associated protein E n=1 Tax=Ascaris suum TaxID=6253 RepID=F1KTE8_ASCSU